MKKTVGIVAVLWLGVVLITGQVVLSGNLNGGDKVLLVILLVLCTGLCSALVFGLYHKIGKCVTMNEGTIFAKYFMYKVIQANYFTLGKELESLETHVLTVQEFDKLCSEDKVQIQCVFFDRLRILSDPSSNMCCIGYLMDSESVVSSAALASLASKSGCDQSAKQPAASALTTSISVNDTTAYSVSFVSWKVISVLEKLLKDNPTKYPSIWKNGELHAAMIETYFLNTTVYSVPLAGSNGFYYALTKLPYPTPT